MLISFSFFFLDSKEETVKRNSTRHIEGELILGGALASVEGSSHLGDRAPA
jgi:hypothetical protein